MNHYERKQFLLLSLSLVVSLFVLFVVVVTDFEQVSEPPRELVIEFHSTTPLPEIQETVAVEPDIDDAELDCLAKNIYHEARGESREGKLAVAHVTMNRVHSNRFPDTVCGVVHQAVYSKWWWEEKGKRVPVRNKCQFSWYCDGKSDRIRLTTSDGNPIAINVRAWAESQDVAMEVMLGLTEDNTLGATYYYNPSLADPDWKHYFTKTVIVDNHKFMRMP